MAEYSAIAQQTINPGEFVIFTTTVVPCNRGLIMHRENTGVFILSGWTPRMPCCQCGCCSGNGARYLARFDANIAIPSTGTAGEIQVALALEGVSLPETIMTVTPTATEAFFNVGKAITIPVFRGCCETFGVRNISDQPIIMSNANLILSRPDLTVTY